MKPNLVIIRGVPGSGKSTFARQKFPDYTLVENDQFYKGDNLTAQECRQAHLQCLDTTVNLLKSGTNVAVANTFSSHVVDEYIKHCGPLSSIKIYWLHTSGTKSIHKVPMNVVERMIASMYWSKDNFDQTQIFPDADHGPKYKYILPDHPSIRENTLSDVEKALFIPGDEQIAMRQQLFLQQADSDDVDAHYDFLASCVMTLISPLRTEWSKMKVVDTDHDDQKQNLLVLTNDLFKIRLCPDEEFNPALCIDPINLEMKAILVDSLQRFPRKYVFASTSNPNKAMSVRRYEHLVENMYFGLFNKKTDIRMLRRSYVSHLDNNRLSYNTRLEISKDMRFYNGQYGDLMVFEFYRVVPSNFPPKSDLKLKNNNISKVVSEEMTEELTEEEETTEELTEEEYSEDGSPTQEPFYSAEYVVNLQLANEKLRGEKTKLQLEVLALQEKRKVDKELYMALFDCAIKGTPHYEALRKVVLQRF